MYRLKSVLMVTMLTLLGLFASQQAGAQSAKIRRADAFYEAGGYAEAIPMYKKNLETVPKEMLGDYLFKVADCYRRTGNARQAELWFQKAIMRNCSNPKAHLYYANALLANEDYDKARESYEKYKTLVPNDPLADNGLQSIELAKAWKSSPSGYIIKPMRVLNSRSDDFSPMYGSADYRTLLFTSSRDEATGKARHAATGDKFTDIFVSMSNGEGRWSKPKPLGGSINTNFEEGTPNFNADYTVLYFTRCRASKKGKLGCQIYEAPQTGEGWDNAKSIPLAGDSMVVAHPAISADGLTLYFCSDIPGGFGGLDIWKVTRTDKAGEWGKPVNLGGQINTAGDEMFPYVHPDGTLYFSSNGLPGMGGLDIFKAVPQENGEYIVENMRYPINSPADDFGITFQKEREEGFFTSRRREGPQGDNIYWFYLPPLEFNLIGQVTDEKSGEPIPNVNVRLVGSDGRLMNGKTDKAGKFKFMLSPNTDYVAITSGEGYLNGKLKASTKGKTGSEDIEISVAMNSMAQPIVLPNIFYDFNSWGLRPESQVALDGLIEVLNENPKIIIELGAHTDSRGSLEYNHELSQKRAQSVVNYLIEHGIPAGRLRAKGYAQTAPFVVDARLQEQYSFLPQGQILDDAFISSLDSEESQEAAYQANRRTEFRVLSNDYEGNSPTP